MICLHKWDGTGLRHKEDDNGYLVYRYCVKCGKEEILGDSTVDPNITPHWMTFSRKDLVKKE